MPCEAADRAHVPAGFHQQQITSRRSISAWSGNDAYHRIVSRCATAQLSCGPIETRT